MHKPLELHATDKPYVQGRIQDLRKEGFLYIKVCGSLYWFYLIFDKYSMEIK